MDESDEEREADDVEVFNTHLVWDGYDLEKGQAWLIYSHLYCY